jgi:hypothetical protein
MKPAEEGMGEPLTGGCREHVHVHAIGITILARNRKISPACLNLRNTEVDLSRTVARGEAGLD